MRGSETIGQVWAYSPGLLVGAHEGSRSPHFAAILDVEAVFKSVTVFVTGVDRMCFEPKGDSC